MSDVRGGKFYWLLLEKENTALIFLISFKFAFQGYLQLLCKLLKENLEKMPGDSRTQIGFITFDSTVHFYSLKVGNKSSMISVSSCINRVINMQGWCIRNTLGSPLGSSMSNLGSPSYGSSNLEIVIDVLTV